MNKKERERLNNVLNGYVDALNKFREEFEEQLKRIDKISVKVDMLMREKDDNKYGKNSSLKTSPPYLSYPPIDDKFTPTDPIKPWPGFDLNVNGKPIPKPYYPSDFCKHCDPIKPSYGTTVISTGGTDVSKQTPHNTSTKAGKLTNDENFFNFKHPNGAWDRAKVIAALVKLNMYENIFETPGEVRELLQDWHQAVKKLQQYEKENKK